MQFRFPSALLAVLLFTAKVTHAALNAARPQYSNRIPQLQQFSKNASTTASLTPINSEYEEYPIPHTYLTLHLTLHLPLDKVAMDACLVSASVWVRAQSPQSAGMLSRDFEWKDGTGALFYINSLSKRLTWKDVGDVLRGLRLSLYDQGKYIDAAFTVGDSRTKTFIGVGRLEKYVLPKPTVLPVFTRIVESA